MKLLTALSLFIFFPVSAYASDISSSRTEQIFSDAIDYTVQIRTLVETPFIEDEQGSFEGTGFVVDAFKGWVMTNAHVVTKSPSNIMAKFQYGEYLPAKKVYVDPYIDIAIIELNEVQKADLTSAELECKTFPSVGHSVGAFGHPWGFEYTGTMGIVSGMTSTWGPEMLQTDAPINSGNSGGPLISLTTGKVVGVNTSSLDDEEDQNTNFVTPMPYACTILKLLQDGKNPSPPDLKAMFYTNLDNTGVLKISKTYFDDGEKASLDIKADDIVKSVSGQKDIIRNQSQLIDALRGDLEGIELTIERAGQDVSVKGSVPPMAYITERKGVYFSGVLIAPNNYTDGKDINFTSPLMVHHVDVGSWAESNELSAWDYLTGVDDQVIKTVEDLFNYLKNKQQEDEGALVTLKFKRLSEISTKNLFDHFEVNIPIENLELL